MEHAVIEESAPPFRTFGNKLVDFRFDHVQDELAADISQISGIRTVDADPMNPAPVFQANPAFAAREQQGGD
ncbi:MAG: hypothetical protein AAFV30_06075, partial [Pseudomonadota bacterium]